jgi:hypothetical protein
VPSAPPNPFAGDGSSTESSAPIPGAAQALSCPLTGPLSLSIPTGFQPVAAVRCVPVSGQAGDVGKQVAVSNLGPLVTALSEPSAIGKGVNPVPRCLAPVAENFQLALVGANGQVIEPAIPVTICGSPLQQVVTSLAGLDWITAS